MLLNGPNPLLLLRELRELGRLRIELDTVVIPPLGQIDSERCYLAWDMVLTAPTTREAIRDVFIFVEDDCVLAIEGLFEQVVEAPSVAILPATPSVAERRSANAPVSVSSIHVSTEKLHPASTTTPTSRIFPRLSTV